MCDYSLHNVASRPAQIRDQLVTTRFAGSDTGGFAAVGCPDTAVCLLPGTEVTFEQEVTYRRPFDFLLFWRPPVSTGHKVARFRQVNVEKSYLHHDALEFPDGQLVLLTRLRRGQRATVIQLPATRRPEKAPNANQPHERQTV